MGRFTCNGVLSCLTHPWHLRAVWESLCLPADNRDCNGVLNCPWYHGCSESKHGFVAARRCVCSYDYCSCGAAAWVVHLFPLPTNPRGRGWVGECSMLAQCELRHNVAVSPHAVGMLHSLCLCGRRLSAVVAAAEWFRQRIRRIRLALRLIMCFA